jgi:hypothetical protein
LHAAGCREQRLFGDRVEGRRAIAYGVRHVDGSRIDRTWRLRDARAHAASTARDRRRRDAAAVVFAIFADDTIADLASCVWDVGAGAVRWSR